MDITISRKIRISGKVLVLLSFAVLFAALLPATGCNTNVVPGSEVKVAKVDTAYVYEANITKFIEDYRHSQRTKISNFIGFTPDEILSTRERAIDNEIRAQIRRLPGVEISTREVQLLADQQMEDLAWELYTELINNQADFASLAREHSSGITARMGGQLQPFGVVANPELYQEHAYSMEVGDISEPFSSWAGWHIIRLDEIKDDPISGRLYIISMILLKPDMGQAEATIVDRIAGGYTIEILDPKYNSRRAIIDGNYEDALRIAENAIARNADDDLAHYLKALALYNLGRVDEALAELETAAQAGRVADALAPYYHYYRGLWLRELGRNDDALAAYHAAYENWRQDINIAYLLRDQFTDLGDTEYVTIMQNEIDSIIAQDAVALALEPRRSSSPGVIATDQGRTEGTSAEYIPGYRE